MPERRGKANQAIEKRHAREAGEPNALEWGESSRRKVERADVTADGSAAMAEEGYSRVSNCKPGFSDTNPGF